MTENRKKYIIYHHLSFTFAFFFHQTLGDQGSRGKHSHRHLLVVSVLLPATPLVADHQVEEDLPGIPREEHRHMLPQQAGMRPFLKQAVGSPRKIISITSHI